mgnify:CR=1 FL=1|tara:strand:+ start:3529 stop:6984 length:3456 start_codon:yes stop_codon:yes gene_type:complete
MAEAIIEKLKVKPQPKRPTAVEFKIGQQNKLEIQDGRKESVLNRDEIMERLKGIKQVKSLDSKVEEKVKKKIKLVRKKTTAVDDVPGDKVGKVRKIKKLKGKTIVLGIKKDTISELGRLKERVTKAPDLKVIAEETVEGDFEERKLDLSGLPPPMKRVNIIASQYYLNNRKKFINFINGLYDKYRTEIIKKEEQPKKPQEEQCASKKSQNKKFELLTHQNIVRDYLNMYTPYRGLLLYHGLGSGKTCSSIGIAEGLKNDKRIIVMIPASLKMNYIEELKNCGDPLYKRNQHWDFIKVDGNKRLIEELHVALSISREYIERNNGAWLVNVKKESNYESLDRGDQISLENQLDEMIGYKYQFINYNGLRRSKLETFKRGGNIFSDSVVIIDEVHNFISRIAGKLNNDKSLSYELYQLLLNAKNCKMVLLTGTPIINYPNEIAILFNIICGYINVWKIPVSIETAKKLDGEEMKKIINGNFNMVDYVNYNPTTNMLEITQNPYGFINVANSGNYKGMMSVSREMQSDSEYVELLIKNYESRGIKIDESMIDLDLYKQRGSINDEGFMSIIEQGLKRYRINIRKREIKVEQFKLLPDRLDDFKEKFINSDNSIVNADLLQRRILGMTSYYGDLEELMPAFDEDVDIKTIYIDMSDPQLLLYESARNDERDNEKRNKRKGPGGVYDDNSSTYRIFSRQYCNFIFPSELKRPMPKDIKEQMSEFSDDINAAEEITPENKEAIVDLVPDQSRLEQEDGTVEPDDIQQMERQKATVIDDSYVKRIDEALDFLSENRDTYLTKEGLSTYSPKFLNILENVLDTENHQGLHLLYSNFRTLEGIGILKLVFETNGMAELKLKKEGGSWLLDVSPENMSKPKFALYTGKEDAEVKELIRKIYNGTWDDLPQTLSEQLKAINANNNMGEIVKLLMITASGAEGISLQNCRFVHITEPYWHPVRTKQVIGRARRICSHYRLPEEFRNVKVFQYVMRFSEEQIKDKISKELRRFDVSKLDKRQITSDEHLLEISGIKEEINRGVLKAIKETSIDCNIHANSGKKEGLSCFSFGAKVENEFSIKPNIANDEGDKGNIEEKTGSVVEVRIKIAGKKVLFALNKDTNEVYDYQSFKDYTDKRIAAPIVKGMLKLIKLPDGKSKRQFVEI